MLRFLSEALEGLQVEDNLNLPSSAVEALKVPIAQVLPLNKVNTLVLTGFPRKDVVANEIEPKSYESPVVPHTTVQHLLSWVRKTHKGNNAEVIVWNLSGHHCDYQTLSNNVLQYPIENISPCPPFTVICEIAYTMFSWIMKESSSQSPHIGMIHDENGRTSALVAACALSLANRNRFQHEIGKSSVFVQKAVREAFIALNMDINVLFSPSQIRYWNYFTQSRRNGFPSTSNALVLQRIIVNGVPDFVNGMGSESQSQHLKDRKVTLYPMAKVYRGGIAIAATEVPSSSSDVMICEDDGSFILSPISKHIKDGSCVLQGDATVKVFNTVWDDAQVPRLQPMFCIQLHTDFVNGNVTRFSKEEVDGARDSNRFPSDFFVDLVMVPASDQQQREMKDAVPVRIPRKVIPRSINSGSSSSDSPNRHAARNQINKLVAAEEQIVTQNQSDEMLSEGESVPTGFDSGNSHDNEGKDYLAEIEMILESQDGNIDWDNILQNDDVDWNTADSADIDDLDIDALAKEMLDDE